MSIVESMGVDDEVIKRLVYNDILCEVSIKALLSQKNTELFRDKALGHLS